MRHNWFGELQFYNAEHHQHVRMRRQDDRRRTNRTHRVGALPQSHPGLCGTLLGPGKDTDDTPVPLREGGRGWPKTRFTRHHQNDMTKVTAPRLGDQHGRYMLMIARKEPVCNSELICKAHFGQSSCYLVATEFSRCEVELQSCGATPTAQRQKNELCTGVSPAKIECALVRFFFSGTQSPSPQVTGYGRHGEALSRVLQEAFRLGRLFSSLQCGNCSSTPPSPTSNPPTLWH